MGSPFRDRLAPRGPWGHRHSCLILGYLVDPCSCLILAIMIIRNIRTAIRESPPTNHETRNPLPTSPRTGKTDTRNNSPMSDTPDTPPPTPTPLPPPPRTTTHPTQEAGNRQNGHAGPQPDAQPRSEYRCSYICSNSICLNVSGAGGFLGGKRTICPGQRGREDRWMCITMCMTSYRT